MVVAMQVPAARGECARAGSGRRLREGRARRDAIEHRRRMISGSLETSGEPHGPVAGAKPGTGESRASSPRRAIRQFLMPKQELQSPPAMSPSEKGQVDATSRRELFKVQASPAEVNQKLRAEKVAMPLGTATHSTPMECLEEVKAKIARLEMSDAARSVLTADIAQLGSIITKPAAHRNVAQEDAENALYAEGTAIVNDFCKRTGNLRKAKEAMNAALRMKSEKSCSWELVDLNNPDELELMTSSSMKNEASPEIQHLNQQITLIDTQAKVIRDECFQRMSVLYQLPSGDRRRIEAKDFKSLKSLQLDQGTGPEKGMKFLITHRQKSGRGSGR
jgi:hypothetical protein